jgi:hypothetical protein
MTLLATAKDAICDGTAVLDRIGLTPDKVRELVARHTLLPPERVIELVAQKKQCYGRRGLPEVIVNAMIADYRRTNSLAKTAVKFNRTRQALWQILGARIALNDRKRHAPIFYKEGKFTPAKSGYLRRSVHPAGEETFLHRIVWIEHKGQIPPGHQVMFRDGDRGNCAIENLYCVSRQAARAGQPSCNAWTKFYRGLGPRPDSSIGRVARSNALKRVWANCTRAQRKRRCRGIHRRWIERRKLKEAA